MLDRTCYYPNYKDYRRPLPIVYDENKDVEFYLVHLVPNGYQRYYVLPVDARLVTAT